MSDDRMQTRQRREEPATRIDIPRFHSGRLLTAALATPLAWFAQMFVGEVLTSQACALSDPLRPTSPPTWVTTALAALSVACLIVGVAGAIIAWRAVVFTRDRRGHGLDGRARRVAELEWFLARVSALSSAMFMFALVTTAVAVVVVSPCGQW
ncbi:hypothetical protein [Paraburkholderia diazotrophica]|uniref:hypothetical protein n=1 Tax=Paraburkholderia diazotrophica TaxID=667676 RepID=UPI003176A3B8